MADPKGDHLYVNLAASEVRRRLKGFGHGVRKIQSAGKNRALVNNHEKKRLRQSLKKMVA